METLGALNCLLQSRRRCGYSVDDHRHRHPPRHRHCRWRIVDFWCRQSPVDTLKKIIVQYCSSDYDNNTALWSKHHTAPRFVNTAESAFPSAKHLLNSDACFAIGAVVPPLRASEGFVNVVRIHGRNGYALSPRRRRRRTLFDPKSANVQCITYHI